MDKTYTILEDKRTVKPYLDTIDRMATGLFRGLVEEEGPQVAGVTTRYPTRTPTDGDADIVTDAQKRRQGLAQAILWLAPEYMQASDVEQMALDAFDFRRSDPGP